jgi:two-component system, NarL family, sensor kinase
MVGSAAIFILCTAIIGFVVFYQRRSMEQRKKLSEAEAEHQRKLLDATIQISEKEREKISKNIHDEIGTYLNVIRLNQAKIVRHASDTVMIMNLMEENNKLLEETIQSVRAISHDLMSPTLVKLGFIKAISELCRQIRVSGSMQISSTTNLDDFRFSPKVEMQLYRICKEVINNIIKHAKASNTLVTMLINNNHISIDIEHNGDGIDTSDIESLAANATGLGLKSIFSRAQTINATVQYISLPNQLSKVIIDVNIG